MTEISDEKPSDDQNEDISSSKTHSNILKVKGDPPDISDEDRSKRLRSLAGAIAHGLRQYGEVQVRCLGDVPTAKGAKAIAMASGFVAVHGLNLYCRPTFMNVEMTDKTMTGICYICVNKP